MGFHEQLASEQESFYQRQAARLAEIERLQTEQRADDHRMARIVDVLMSHMGIPEQPSEPIEEIII